ncbi:hypothetical protein GOODEAATRI_027859 [Goodea atripinnis]|uniref:Uncharacterized protein n=1 Tax=Goodea atripinnis TaxID=208336 RepID=A0ABV0MLA0_9TELE
MSNHVRLDLTCQLSRLEELQSRQQSALLWSCNMRTGTAISRIIVESIGLDVNVFVLYNVPSKSIHTSLTFIFCFFTFFSQPQLQCTLLGSYIDKVVLDCEAEGK